MYAVLFREGRAVLLAGDSGMAVPVATFPSLLANTGKPLQLVNAAGVVIDSVTYSEAQAACSWERGREGCWYLSNDIRGGTPGAANSPERIPSRWDEHGELPEEDWIVYEKDIIFNEILPEPFPGGSEYIELYNRSGRPLRLVALSVATRQANGVLRTLCPLASLAAQVAPDGYVALAGNRDGVLNFYAPPSPEAVHEVKLPELNNTGASLVLCRTRDSVVIDEVAYASRWHDGAVKNARGVSLERIHPEAATQDASNWTSATAATRYGTPGYPNSQSALSGRDGGIRLNTPEHIPERDEYVIAYRFDKTGYRVKMEIYTAEGRKVAEISNNQLVGQEGEIRLDGYGLNCNRLPPDVYIFYVEYYHPDGQRKAFKKVFLVRK